MRCTDHFSALVLKYQRRLDTTQDFWLKLDSEANVELLLLRPSGDFSHFLARLFVTNEAQTVS